MSGHPTDADPDLVWLAGLLEGEGSFDLHHGRYPRVRLAMTDRDIVERAASLMGTSCRVTLRAAPYQALWNANVHGEKAASLMRRLLPYMGSRRSGRIAQILGHAPRRAA